MMNIIMYKEYEYNVYIGIDKGDPILDNLKEQGEITRFSKALSRSHGISSILSIIGSSYQ